MKKITYILFFVLISTVTQAGNICGTGKASSDSDMLSCEEKSFALADKKLNEIYGKLIKSLDPEGQQKLRKAQRAWVNFRDLNATFSGDLNRGGSAEPLNIMGAKNIMTKNRIKELQSEFDSRQ